MGWLSGDYRFDGEKGKKKQAKAAKKSAGKGSSGGRKPNWSKVKPEVSKMSCPQCGVLGCKRFKYGSHG